MYAIIKDNVILSVLNPEDERYQAIVDSPAIERYTEVAIPEEVAKDIIGGSHYKITESGYEKVGVTEPGPAQGAHPSLPKIKLPEIVRLKNYLRDTDWIYIKCMETGLLVRDEYPEIVSKRMECRERINEIESSQSNTIE